MIFKGDDPTDFPHLETFIDWLYEHVEELPSDVETLKARVQYWHPKEQKEQMREDVNKIIAQRQGCPKCGVESGQHHTKGCPNIGGIA